MRNTLLALLTLWMTPATQGMYMKLDVEKVPVARVIENLERRLVTEPENHDLHYQLARSHAMAATPGVENLNVIKDKASPKINGTIQFAEGSGGNGTPENGHGQRRKETQKVDFGEKHLGAAIKHYETAMALMRSSKDRERNAWLIRPLMLGYAWCLDKAGRRDEAIEAYRQTLAIAWHVEITCDFNEEDWFNGVKYDVHALKDPVNPEPLFTLHTNIGPGVCFTEESIGYLLDLLDTKKDAIEINQLNSRKKTVAGIGRSITPILIPLTDAPFAGLVNPKANVAFDLDGSGQSRQWGWITPNAAWLVFDGKQTGQITSGLQMFGSVTFWIFWRDGYQALGSLDANGDGLLNGAELNGLALWQDINGNGISESGEVKPLATYGIDQLSCRGEYAGPGLRQSPQGIRFKDGSVRPSYDWDSPMCAPAAAK
jgi:tetratricopeptide (TPR) repeat protein